MRPELAPGTHRLTVNGVVQRYHVHGTGPVCIVHPGGPGLSWGYLRLPHLESSYTMVYVEPAGTGESGRLPATDRYTLARYAVHLRAIVDAVGGRGAALLGHAHGGSVVQKFLTTYPDSVLAVVLVCSSPVGSEELIRETEENLSRFAEQHAHHGEAVDVAAAYLDVLTAIDDHTLTHAVRRLFPAFFRDYWDSRAHASHFKLRSEITAWADPSNRGGWERTDLRDRLAQVRTPALVVSGEWDPIISPRWSRALEASMPVSRLVRFPGSAHMPHLEEPATFSRIVTEFLSRVKYGHHVDGCR
jgi:proline iminopeptidase